MRMTEIIYRTRVPKIVIPDQPRIIQCGEGTAYPTPSTNAGGIVGIVPRGMTALELLAAKFPEPRWAIPGLIPEGLMILAGKPKVGKSWFGLSIALSVSYGIRALGKIALDAPAHVLYLALEDSYRRLQDRMMQLVGDDTPPEKLDLHIKWRRGLEAIADIEKYLKNYPDTKLVIVDTMQKFRSPKSGAGKRSEYVEAYEELTPLLELAHQYHVAIILITHTRKDGDCTLTGGDFLDSVLGSTGISGTADTIAVLTRDRTKHNAILKITGRDLKEDMEYALLQDSQAGWQIAGEANEYNQSQERKNILQVLKEAAEPIPPKEIAETLGIPPKKDYQIRQLLGKLLKDGMVSKTDNSRYYLSTLSTASTPSTQSELFTVTYENSS